MTGDILSKTPFHHNLGGRNKGWISWYNYLENEMLTTMLPFREAREIARRLGIKNVGEHFGLHTTGQLPKGLPHDHNDVYSKGENR
jgi:hypothetical protein